MLFLHREALEQVPFFRGHDPLFITDVAAMLQLQHFAPGNQGLLKGEEHILHGQRH
jgi:hypothetical protein